MANLRKIGTSVIDLDRIIEAEWDGEIYTIRMIDGVVRYAVRAKDAENDLLAAVEEKRLFDLGRI